jgi:hypothetical protein
MHHRPSILALIAFLFAVTQSTTSYPILTSKWVKEDQFEDTKAHGLWKAFQKEGLDILPEPLKAKYHLVCRNVNKLILTSMIHGVTKIALHIDPIMVKQPK